MKRHRCNIRWPPWWNGPSGWRLSVLATQGQPAIWSPPRIHSRHASHVTQRRLHLAAPKSRTSEPLLALLFASSGSRKDAGRSAAGRQIYKSAIFFRCNPISGVWPRPPRSSYDLWNYKTTKQGAEIPLWFDTKTTTAQTQCVTKQKV